MGRLLLEQQSVSVFRVHHRGIIKMVLTVYSAVDCTGDSKEIKDSEVNLSKVGVKFSIKSVKVDGNPGGFFTEERYTGFLAYLEEGTYNNLEDLGLPKDYKVASVKYKKDSLAFPQIRLFNSSTFKDNSPSTWWCHGDEEGAKKMKYIDVGLAGIWVINVDQSVMYKEGTGHGSTGIGGAWCNIMGKMRQLSVGAVSVWAVNPADEVFVRSGLNDADPKGKEWTKIDGTMKMVSVGPSGVCWAVDKKDTVWRRLGAKNTSAIGTKWQSVTGRLGFISVGPAGIWGISPKNEVMYRDGTYDLPGDAEGTGWSKVDGMMVWLSSGQNIVWGISANGEMWYRAGIDQNNPMGTNWFKMNTGTSVESWKQAVGWDNILWTIDGGDLVRCKDGATRDCIEPGNSITLMTEHVNFKSYNMQEKPSSYSVINSGWVMYEKPNFKGKCLYHYGATEGDCYSNDPENKKGPKLKQWQEPIGSIRFLRGTDAKALSVAVVMDWEAATTEYTTSVLSTFEGKNSSFEYQPATWQRIVEVEGKVTHSLKLDEAVTGLAGKSFTLEGVPKAGFTFNTVGNKLETMTDFRQELSSMFTFITEDSTRRERTKIEAVSLPPCIAPKTEVKISIIIHHGTVKIPFKALFVSGNSKWEVPGKYVGEDATHVKVQQSETSLLEGNRKVSRM